MSFGHPQLAHSRSAHVTRKGRIYYYRRRLPAPRTGEVAISLRTGSFREAQHLAEMLDAIVLTAIAGDVDEKEIGRRITAYVFELVDAARQKYDRPAKSPWDRVLPPEHGPEVFSSHTSIDGSVEVAT